jgi:guanylate kinase
MMIVLDTVGAMSVSAQYPSIPLVGILPPSLPTLLARLTARGTDSIEQMEIRFLSAYAELSRMHNCNYSIINDDLDTAVDQLETVLKVAETGAHTNVNHIVALQDEIESFEEHLSGLRSQAKR